MMTDGYIFPTIIKKEGAFNPLNLHKNENVSLITTDLAAIECRFEKKITGYVFFELADNTADRIVLRYGPYKEAVMFQKTFEMTQSGQFFIDDEILSMQYLELTVICDAFVKTSASCYIKYFGIRSSSYPYVQNGEFRTDVDLYNDIWQAGAYTLKLCTQEFKNSSSSFDMLCEESQKFIKSWTNPYSKYVIFDGPRRDREAWIGDIRTEALIAYTAFGDDLPIKSSLKLFYDEQNSMGLVPGSGATRQEFVEYNLWWVITVYEHYLHTADIDFLKTLYEGVRKFTDYIFFTQNEKFFIPNDKSWMWTFSRSGYGSANQCIQYHALLCIANIEGAVGDKNRADDIMKMREALRENIVAEFWDDERGVMLDNISFDTPVEPIFLDINAFAVCFGILDSERATRALNYLEQNMWTPYGSTTTDIEVKTAHISREQNAFLYDIVSKSDNPDKRLVEFMWAHNKKIWPFATAYEVEANFINNNPERAFKLIKNCWGNMIEKGANTFWEMLDIEDGTFTAKSHQKGAKNDCVNSAAHAWSGWISYILQTYVAGVKPISPGYKKCFVRPMLGEIKSLRCVIPTTFGKLTLKIDVDDGETRIQLTKPAEVEVECDLSCLTDATLTVQNI